MVRSSSSIAPRMRGTQYVSNFTPRFEVEGVDGVHQAEDAGADQVVQLHAVGQPGPDPLGVVLDQRQVPFDQPVAQLDGRPVARYACQTCGTSMSDVRHHRAPP